jgi:hypothetical protein
MESMVSRAGYIDLLDNFLLAPHNSIFRTHHRRRIGTTKIARTTPPLHIIIDFRPRIETSQSPESPFPDSTIFGLKFPNLVYLFDQRHTLRLYLASIPYKDVASWGIQVKCWDRVQEVSVRRWRG